MLLIPWELTVEQKVYYKKGQHWGFQLGRFKVTLWMAQRRKGTKRTRMSTDRRGRMRKHREHARSSTDVRAADKNLWKSCDKATYTKIILAMLIIISMPWKGSSPENKYHFGLLMRHLTGECPADPIGIRDADKCLLMKRRVPYDRVVWCDMSPYAKETRETVLRKGQGNLGILQAEWTITRRDWQNTESIKCLFPYLHHTKRTIILPCRWCPPYFLYNGPARVTILRWSHTCRCSTSANPKLHNSSSWSLFMGPGRVVDILCPKCVFCNFCVVCHVRVCLDCCYPSITRVASIRFLLLLFLRRNRKSAIAGPVSTDSNSNFPYEFCKWVSSRERWYNHKNKTRNASSKWPSRVGAKQQECWPGMLFPGSTGRKRTELSCLVCSSQVPPTSSCHSH